MIKMIIKMDENKVNKSQYTIEHIYNALDNMFLKMGYKSEDNNCMKEYLGNNSPRDFGRFGKIYNTLKKQAWFMDNASTWILCNSDDSDDPMNFSEEDLLAFNKKKVAVK